MVLSRVMTSSGVVGRRLIDDIFGGTQGGRGETRLHGPITSRRDGVDELPAHGTDITPAEQLHGARD